MNTIKDKQLKYDKALEYEIFIKEEYGFAKDKIIKAETIFDIWWHVWLFSKRCRSQNPTARIHYFEPVGEFYDKAKKLLQNDKNIILNNNWISSKTETWTILLNEEKTMQSSKYTSFLNPKWKETKVSFIELKEYLINNNINNIDVLKMDIEWIELEVLSSWWDYEQNIINNIIIEVHLFNKEMNTQYEQILKKIKKIFSNIEIINQWYRKEIFVIWGYKETWL